ncbi:hypothetical protein Prudu_016979, partial [Prunus dulcis]
STAKRVRRHGVDPNRSYNEEDMFFLSPFSLLPRDLGVRPFAFSATARPPQAELISPVGTIGSASVSPSRPDRPPPRGRPELAGKPCFPKEVRPNPPEIPAQNSPSFLHQIDRVRHQEPDRTAKETFKGSQVARTICCRSTRDPPPGHSKLPRHLVRGDSAEFSAEV